MGAHQVRRESSLGWDTMLDDQLGELAVRSSDQWKRIVTKRNGSSRRQMESTMYAIHGGETVVETSVEVWNALAALLKYGPLAVVWSQGNGHGGFDTFDTVIQLWGNEIRQRTYCQEKPATATRRAEPAEFRFSDAFPRDRAPFAARLGGVPTQGPERRNATYR